MAKPILGDALWSIIRAAAARTSTTPLPVSGAQADHAPPGAHRHPLRAEDGTGLEPAAPGDALRQAVRTHDATPGITDRHGSTFVVDFVMTRADTARVYVVSGSLDAARIFRAW
jgi:hypothetical protein